MRSRLRLLFGISVFWLALSMLFDGLNTLVLPAQLAIYTDEAHQATALGLTAFVGILLGMLVQPVAGVFSDRLRAKWGRRGVIASGMLLMLASLAAFGISQTLLAVILSYLFIQASASVAQAAQQGFIPDLVPAESRGKAAGFKGFMDLGGALLAFALLGQFLSEGRTDLALLAIAAVIVVTFGLTVLLVREHPATVTAPTHAVTLADAFRLDLREHRAFAWVVLSRFLFLLGTYMVGRFLLYFVADWLGLDPPLAAEQAGNLLFSLTLVTALGALAAGWAADRFGRMPLMLLGAALSAIGVLLLMIAGSELQILLFGGLMALGSAAFAGANWALTADLIPPAESARFMALANFGTAGAAAAAGLLGPLVDWANGITPGAGYAALFIFAALAFAGSALALRGMVTQPVMAASQRAE
jgi:MFS family permease